jgi:RimJ/RimL family protein N-acetyltransferase/nitroimidazol reductase NimA-like FMN-containing flavoprotein (pyridoxamine 5'-phosphate oxidase superfamily)
MYQYEAALPTPEVPVASAPSPRTVPARYADRARYDRAVIDAILDEALVAHLGFVTDGAPRVLPTLHARVGDTVYLHGSTGSTPLRPAQAEVCLTVTLLDGLVLARSAFNHSVAYRSVMVQGRARTVTDEAEKRRVLDALVEHVATGRAAGCRPPTRKELAATAVLALPLTEASAKLGGGPGASGDPRRPGQPWSLDDEPADRGLPYWGGFLPLRTVPEAPIASADLGPIPVPGHVSAWRRPGAVGEGAARLLSPWWDAPVLAGRQVRLEPLGPQHIHGLWQNAADPEVHAHLPHPLPRSEQDIAGLVAAGLRDAASGAKVPFAQVDPATGQVLGTTSYYEIDPVRRQLAIGATWLGRPWWRTGVNTESKLLLLTRAFETLGCTRVTWHTDVRNERSQAAIARLGAQREGVIRHHRLRRDGTWRDTVCFGMTEDEWPACRDALAGRLEPAS